MTSGESNSDWTSDEKERKFTVGYMFEMCGEPVSWSSRKHTVVATSSYEAEYSTLCSACKKNVWMIHIARFSLKPNSDEKAINVSTESQCAMKLKENSSIIHRSKHIDIAFHYVQDVVAGNMGQLKYIPYSEMIADTLTKGLGRVAFEKFRLKCGLQSQGEQAS